MKIVPSLEKVKILKELANVLREALAIAPVTQIIKVIRDTIADPELGPVLREKKTEKAKLIKGKR